MDISRKVKWTILAALVAMSSAAAPVVYKLGIAFGLWQPVRRPRGVSPAAQYVSWIEGGTWFECSADMKRNLDFCRAWDEDGRSLGSGAFRIECEDRAATQDQLRPSSAISGGGSLYMIYLFGDRGPQTMTLVHVDSAGRTPCAQVR